MVVDSGRGTLVLIVEDEPDNREIMRAVVEDLLGYRAMLANDGMAAIDAATANQPSLILMDLMMPALDGFEATRRIKANPLTSHIPVVAVTALGRPTDRQRAVEGGADAYLSKPFDLDTLAAIIERYASGQQ
jgi:two-component system cell cycle response regulator DivK